MECCKRLLFLLFSHTIYIYQTISLRMENFTCLKYNFLQKEKTYELRKHRIFGNRY